MLISLIIYEKYPGQNSKCQNEQKAISQKLGKKELWFFNNALLLDDINVPDKVQSEKINKGQ
jgi:hypothetical protein